MNTDFGKWLKGLFLTILLLLTLAIAALVYVLDTPDGTRWLFDRLSASLPGRLHIQNIEGSLWRGATLEAVEYANAGQEISATNLHFVVEWPDLIYGRLVLKRVNANSIAYRDTNPPDTARKALTISIPALPMTMIIKRSSVGELTISGPGSTTRVNALKIKQARLSGHDLAVAESTFTIEDLTLTTTRMTARLQDPVPVSGQIRWRHTKKDLSGGGSIKGSLVKLTFKHVLEHPAKVNTEGSLELLNRVSPLFQSTTDWDEWRIADYQLQRGQIRVNGTPNDYTLSFNANATGPEIPPVTLRGEASGHQSGFVTTDIEVNTEAGTLHLSGPLSWSPELAAQLEVQLVALDPAFLTPHLRGQLSGGAKLLVTGTNKLELRTIDIAGRVNNNTFKTTGAIVWTPEQWLCTACSLSVGGNQLRAEGNYSERQLAVRFSMDAPSLNDLWPGLEGSLTAKGSLRGPIALPRFNGELLGQQLRYGPWSAANLALVSRAQSNTPIQIEASAQTVRRHNHLLGSPHISARGSADDLMFDLRWQRGDIQFASGGTLQRRDADISGSLREASLEEPHSGTWKLDRPLTFGYRDGTLALGEHNWLGKSGSLSLTELKLGREIQLSGQLQQLPLSTVNALLPEGYQLAGTVDAAIELTRKEDIWEGDIAWRQHGTVVHINDPDLESAELSAPRLNLDVKLTQGGAKALLSAHVEPGMHTEISATVQRLTLDTTINGQLHLRGNHWRWLPAVIPTIDDVAGDVSVTMNFKGPLLRPDLSGEAVFRNGQLVLPALNAKLDAIDLALTGKPDGRVTVLGSARAGEGRLTLGGHIDNPLAGTRSLLLTINGESALVTDWPEYRVWASPQLNVHGDADGWRVDGSIIMPRAEIALEDLPKDVVKPSTDVAVLNRPEDRKPNTVYTGRVRVSAGERVHLKATGLKTYVSGDLLVSKKADATLAVEGQLSLLDGVFSAFGQDLTVRKGTLTFGGPLSNPLIDVEAVREIDEFGQKITAGIRMVGYRDDLTTTVFSEPAMGEADALSYLISGRPLTGLTESQGGDLTSAALSLSIHQAARITQEVSRKLGVDQLSVSGSGEQMALVVGKELSSRMYARYAYGVFSQIGTLFLGYRLGEHFRLEAGAGESQTIDLLYTVEKP
ncbi:MAG TPA: hypothetical protein DIT58_01395 [Porticoccaceae bacterium]|nr:hypothetical protein [Porticoccaceae bacterium]